MIKLQIRFIGNLKKLNQLDEKTRLRRTINPIKTETPIELNFEKTNPKINRVWISTKND